MAYCWGFPLDLFINSSTPYTDWWLRYQRYYERDFDPEQNIKFLPIEKLLASPSSEMAALKLPSNLGDHKWTEENPRLGLDEMFPVEIAPIKPGTYCGPPTVSPKGSAEQLGDDDVITAIIDDGIAFANERFLKRDGHLLKTRVKHFWNQDAKIDSDKHPTDGCSVEFGREWSESEINCLIQTNQTDSGGFDEAGVYRDTMMDSLLKTNQCHGTHVLDVAAGYNFSDHKENSKAKKRPIIAVQLPRIATEDASGAFLGVYVSRAVAYILERADRLQKFPNAPRPVVINFSYGIYAGPHDGSGLLESWLDNVIEYRRNRFSADSTQKVTPVSFIVPAGNSHHSSTHARVKLTKGPKPQFIQWRLQPNNKSPNFLEIWTAPFERPVGKKTNGMHEKPSRSNISISILPPSEKTPIELDGPELGKFTPFLDHSGEIVGGIYAEQFDVKKGGSGKLWAKQRYTLVLTRTDNDGLEAVDPDGPNILSQTKNPPNEEVLLSHGKWTVGLKHSSAIPNNCSTDLHLWIQRNDTPSGFRKDGRQGYFEDIEYDLFNANGEPHGSVDEQPGYIQSAGTLNAIATGEHTIRVGAYKMTDGFVDGPAYYSSSASLELPEFANTVDISAAAAENPALPGIATVGVTSGSSVRIAGTSIAVPQVSRMIANLLETGLDPRGHGFTGSRKDVRRVATYFQEPNPADIDRLGCGLLPYAPWFGEVEPKP